MPNEYIPIVAAGIAATAGLVGVWWKNRHDMKMKALDMRLKREEQNHGFRLSYNTRRAQAAESLIKKFTLLLRRLKIQEEFLEALVNGRNTGRPLPIDWEEIARKELESINSIDSKEDVDILSLHYTYFAKDYPGTITDEDQEFAEACAFIDREEDIKEQIRVLSADLLLVLDEHNNSAETPEAKRQLVNLASDKHLEMIARTKELLDIVRLKMQLTENACITLQSEVDGSYLQ